MAGTDLATTKQRATAVSMAMVSTTLGAVSGPNLVGVMGGFANTIGVPALAGPFILAAFAFILAGLVLLILLRPDPLVVSTAIASNQVKVGMLQDERNLEGNKSNKRGVMTGATVMVLTQFVMSSIMTMTPVHMGHHGHSLREVGLVIGYHIGAMYLPSPLTGLLVDKVGRKAIAVAGGLILLVSGVLAIFMQAGSFAVLIIALVLLGLGWNFGLISGTALIVDAAHPSVRAKTQGSVDVLLALSGAAGGGLSGIIVSIYSYEILSLIGAALALLLILVVFWSRKD